MKICYLDDVPSNNFVFEATIKRIDKCNLPDIDIELDLYEGMTDEFIRKIPEYDIIFTDWMMPVYSGENVLQEVRKRDVAKPCVIISAYCGDNVIEKACIRYNCTAIQKPYTKNDIINVLKQYFIERDIVAEWKEYC